MSDLESRVDAIEIELLRKEVDSLKETVAGLKPRRSFWPTVQTVISVLTPFLLAGFGFYVTNNVTSAIEEQQLELSKLNSMREYLVELRQPGVELKRAKALAITIAAFGETALEPLVHELMVDSDVRTEAATEGLRALAFDRPDLVSAKLVQLITGGNRLFTWKTHRVAIGLLGNFGDDEARAAMTGMLQVLQQDDGLARYQAMVREKPKPSKRDLNKIIDELVRAVRSLET